VGGGLDFGHGTGHGVGYFLNVHEGPQSISKAIPDADDGDAARHDHLDRARPVPPRPVGRAHREPGAQRAGSRRPRAAASVRVLAFETLTLCPIDTRCIDRRCCATTRSPGSTPTTPPCANACAGPRRIDLHADLTIGHHLLLQFMTTVPPFVAIGDTAQLRWLH
jgi:hypothetical protein